MSKIRGAKAHKATTGEAATVDASAADLPATLTAPAMRTGDEIKASWMDAKGEIEQASEQLNAAMARKRATENELGQLLLSKGRAKNPLVMPDGITYKPRCSKEGVYSLSSLGEIDGSDI